MKKMKSSALRSVLLGIVGALSAAACSSGGGSETLQPEMFALAGGESGAVTYVQHAGFEADADTDECDLTSAGLDNSLNWPEPPAKQILGFDACSVAVTAMTLPPFGPRAVIVSKVPISSDRIEASLTAYGYSREVIDGVPVFSAAEDVDPRDGFGWTYVFNRVAVLSDGIVVRAGTDEGISDALDRRKETGRGAALQESWSETTNGVLSIADPERFLASLPYSGVVRSDWGTLPPPEALTIWSERDASNSWAARIHLAYGDSRDATEAADLLQRRLTGFVDPLTNEITCLETSVTVDETAVQILCNRGARTDWFAFVVQSARLEFLSLD